MPDLFEEVRDLISKQLGIPPEDIEEDSFLDEDLSITDLDLEDIITKLETKYEIEIPGDKISSFRKISDVVGYLDDNVEVAG